jgi:hypothetical protein
MNLGLLLAFGAIELLLASGTTAKPAAAKPKPKPLPSQTFPLSDAMAKLNQRPPWRAETSKTIAISPDRQYAAEIQLTGFEATFGSAAAVHGKLAELMQWTSLTVFEKASERPAGWPNAAPNASGRYWVLGVPSKAATLTRPDEIAALWSRASV